VKRIERKAKEGEQVRAEGVRENRLGRKALEREQVMAAGVRGCKG